MDKLVVVITDPDDRARAADGPRRHRARRRARAHREPDAAGGEGQLADYVIDNSGTRAETERAGARGLRALLADLRDRARRGDEPAAERARAPAGPPAGRARQDARARPALSPRPGRGATGSSTWWRPPRATWSSRSAPGEGALTGTLAARPGGSSRSRWTRRSPRAPRALRRSPHVGDRRRRRPALRLRARCAALAPDPDGRVLVVGNLPYSVGKPILTALVRRRGAIDEMALMLQREVAERVAAAPGAQGLRQHCRS